LYLCNVKIEKKGKMKILQSSVFRAFCAIAIGILLIKYPDNTVTWITVAIGVLFLLSGIISMVVYYHALRQFSKQEALPGGAYVTDAEGNRIMAHKPTFPIVGVGSAILGLLLALTPNVFVTALMYIIGGILILGAVNQFMNLLNARQYGKVGFGYWIFPCLILLTGLYVIIKPMSPPAIAMLILGWCTLLYGVTELINALKIHNEKRKYAKAQEIPVAEEIKEDTPVKAEGSAETESTPTEDDERYMPVQTTSDPS
jgi:uncharacterized membrane protein HdeD (DUF308 family)